MKILNKLHRLSTVLVLAGVLFAAGGYVLTARASATAGILDTRSISMSTSQNGATTVKYSVTYNYGTSGQTLGAVVIEFCNESPLAGQSCTNPGTSNNFNDNNATAGLLASQTGVTGFTIDTTHSTSRAIVLNRTAAAITGTPTQTFVFGDGSTKGFTNPTYTTNSGNATFYARIYTFTASIGSNWVSTSPGSYTDFAGVALSVNPQLSLQAKVQETLTLCVYTSSCGSALATVVLGDANGILSTSVPYTNATAKFDMATNAASGMTVSLFGDTLKTGAPQNASITAIGSTAALSSSGSEQFGFCVAPGTGVTAASPYNSPSGGACSGVGTGASLTNGAKFAFDTANTTALGGQVIANTSSSPISTATNTIAYLANIAVTTKAGTYTATHTLIALGSF